MDTEQAEQHSEQRFNTTTTANTCGLRITKCGSCNKQFYEDKFMLNRLNKRYRGCIICIVRQRRNRQKTSAQLSTNDINFNAEPETQDLIHMANETPTIPDLIELTNNDNILYKRDDEAYNIEPGTKLIDYPHIEPTQEPDLPIEPNTDISNYSHMEQTTTKQKHHSKQKNGQST